MRRNDSPRHRYPARTSSSIRRAICPSSPAPRGAARSAPAGRQSRPDALPHRSVRLREARTKISPRCSVQGSSSRLRAPISQSAKPALPGWPISLPRLSKVQAWNGQDMRARLAGERLGLLDQFRAAMRAHVAEGAHDIVLAANDQDRGTGGIEHQIIARLGDVAGEARDEWLAQEQVLALGLEPRPRRYRPILCSGSGPSAISVVLPATLATILRRISRARSLRDAAQSGVRLSDGSRSAMWASQFGQWQLRGTMPDSGHRRTLLV